MGSQKDFGSKQYFGNTCFVSKKILGTKMDLGNNQNKLKLSYKLYMKLSKLGVETVVKVGVPLAVRVGGWMGGRIKP